jgi:hypothetical protein
MQKLINALGEMHKELVKKMTAIQLAEYALSRKITVKEKNTLPDVAFAVILPGGERKFSHHIGRVKNPNENSTVDIVHLINSLAELPQSKIPAKYKSIADRHLQKHAKKILKGYKKNNG